MSISEQDKRAIDEAVNKLHYVSTGENGQKYIQIYVDYREDNEALWAPAYENRRLGFESKDNPQFALLDRLKEEIDGWYEGSTFDDEDAIIREAGFDPSDDKAEEQLDYLRDTYPFVPDYDHFLNEETPINLMLDCGDESNRDFIAIREQFEAIFSEDLSDEERKEALEAETGLSWLVRQQGHTMSEVAETVRAYYAFFDSDEAANLNYNQKYKAFEASHNPFLTSICQELANMPNYMNTMTVLTKLSLADLAEFMQPGKEIVIPKESMVGIFNPWNGGGSTLDIVLEKDLIIPSDLLYDIQIEGVKPDHGYSVDNVYGLVGNAWVSAKAVQEAGAGKEDKAPSLDSMIQDASRRVGSAPDKETGSKEHGR